MSFSAFVLLIPETLKTQPSFASPTIPSTEPIVQSLRFTMESISKPLMPIRRPLDASNLIALHWVSIAVITSCTVEVLSIEFNVIVTGGMEAPSRLFSVISRH